MSGLGSFSGIVVDGIDELTRELEAASVEIERRIAALADDTAKSIEAQVTREYAVYDGRSTRKKDRVPLASKVRVSAPTKTGRVVKSTSPHAHLIEYGTVSRETFKGYDRGDMLERQGRERDPIMARAAAQHREKFEAGVREIVSSALAPLGDGSRPGFEDVS